MKVNKTKVKYKIYKISEVEIKPTGKKFEIRGRMRPYGTPLYAIYNLAGKQIYPYYSSSDGEPKNSCENWVKNSCWCPEDKPFKIKVLEKLIGLGAGEKLENLAVVRNDLVYEGNRHNDYDIIFREDKKFFQFNTVQNEVGGLHPGRWMSYGLSIDRTRYLCKRVYPHTKQITITEFKRVSEV